MLGFVLSPNQKRFIRKRIMFTFLFFLVFIFVLLFHIAYIQVIDWGKYQKYSQGQAEQRLPLIATRGRIYDRFGKLIVGNRPAYSLYITPAYFPKNNPESKSTRIKLLKYLSVKLNISISDIVKKITISNKYKQNKYDPVIIKRDLSPRVYAELIEIPKKYLPGIDITVNFMRDYILKDNLSHVIGYRGIIDIVSWKRFQNYYGQGINNPYHDKSTLIGRRGIEKYKDLLLRGRDGILLRMVDSKGRVIANSNSVVEKSIPGKDIYLTIDMNLQIFVKKLMKGKKGVIIVSKPYTGEILSFVSSPSFNPEDIISRDINKIDVISKDQNALLYNRVLHGRYPPGSIFKIIVALAALKDNVSSRRKYNCKGGLKLGSRTFKCTSSHGKLNMTQAIAKSCNVYFYNLARDITWKKIYDMGKRFLLGKSVKTEIGNGWEGYFPDYQWKMNFVNERWFPGDTFNHSIGQGYMLLTPIQIHQIISIIANNGVLKPLYFISKTSDIISGETDVFKNKKSYDLNLNKSSLRLVQRALNSVTTYGTTKFYSIFSKVSSAAKTSTAEHIPGEEPHAVVVVYAPYNSRNIKDRISITVLVERAGWGGMIASPMAVAILRYYFSKISLCQSQISMGRYLGCSPGDEVDFRLGYGSGKSRYDKKLFLRVKDESFIFEKNINYLNNHYSDSFNSLIEGNNRFDLIDWREYSNLHTNFFRKEESFKKTLLKKEMDALRRYQDSLKSFVRRKAKKLQNKLKKNLKKSNDRIDKKDLANKIKNIANKKVDKKILKTKKLNALQNDKKVKLAVKKQSKNIINNDKDNKSNKKIKNNDLKKKSLLNTLEKDNVKKPLKKQLKTVKNNVNNENKDKLDSKEIKKNLEKDKTRRDFKKDKILVDKTDELEVDSIAEEF